MSTNKHAAALRALAEAWSLRGNIEREAADEIDRLEALLAERDKQINAQASTISLQSKQIEERNCMIHDCANTCNYLQSQKPMVTNEEAQAAIKRVAMAGASKDMETLTKEDIYRVLVFRCGHFGRA